MRIHRQPFLAAVLFATIAGADSPEPAPLPAARYAPMAGQSPFAIASAPPTRSETSFAANWYVSGIARLGDTDFVTIKSRDASLQFSLFGREANRQHGVSVASVNWSDTLGKSTVILKRGTETAKLEFNEAEMRGPALVSMPAAGGSPIKPGAPVPAGSRALPTVVTPPSALQQFPPGSGNPGEVRRRVRIIAPPK